MSYLKAFYSEEEKPYTEYPVRLVAYLVRRFILKGKLLDLGCGREEFLGAFFQNFNFETYGFDKEVGAQGVSHNLKVGDFNKKLPYEDNTFNIVFAKSVIEHTLTPENMVSEVYRILKPKGKFIVMTPDWGYHYKTFYEDFTHKTPFVRNSLEKILKMYNFKVKCCERFRQLPFIWKYPKLNFIASVAQLFYHSETKNKLIKFSKEVMLLAVGEK